MPISKNVAKLFPVDRPFTKAEAVLSLQLDHNNGKTASVTGYAKQWGWSKRQVRNLFEMLNVEIAYPADTKAIPKQWGHLQKRSNERTKNGLINSIDFIVLDGKADQKRSNERTLLTRTIKNKVSKDTLCPHEDIISLYHEILPELRKVKKWTEKRQKQLRTRWREEKKRQDLGWWRRYFEYIRKSPFLMNGNNPWLDLEWLINQGNMVKVIEGKYHQD